MQMQTKLNTAFINIFIVLIVNFVYALTVKFFLIPGGLVMGGTTGIALTLNHYFHLSVSTFVLIFNVLMMVVGFFALGKRFALTTLLSSFAYPIFLGILDRVFGEVTVTEDVILNTIFAGLGVGISVGLIIRAGASTGGTDIPVLMLKKYFKVPVPVSMYAFDTCILLSQALFNDVDRLLYGFILAFIYTNVVDKVLLAGSSHTEIKIISQKSDEVKKAIIREMDRGITILNGRGGYLEKETEVLLTVVSNREVPRVEKIVRDIDDECFMTINKISEVRGKGFSLKK